MVNGGESSDSLETESVASRDVENRARSEERNQNRNRPSPRSKSVDPYLGRRRPWSAHISTKAAGVTSSRPVEHRLQYTRGPWDTSANPGHQIDKPGVNADLIHRPHFPKKFNVVHFAGPATDDFDQIMTQSYPPAAHTPLPPPVCTERVPSGMPKVSEYKSQFAWPPGSELGPSQTEPTPRKSISMGALQAAQQAQVSAEPRAERIPEKEPVRVEKKAVLKSPPPVQEPVVVAKRIVDREVGLTAVPPKVDHEDPPLHDEDDAAAPKTKPKKFKTEYKAQFRAPSKYAYVDGTWKKMSRSADSADLQREMTQDAPWYGEVIELRKKAGEYKSRSIGGNLTPEKLAGSFSRQEMIEELSSRSSLKALALATTPSATKKPKGVDGEDMAPVRPQPMVRHHLERTTPPAGEMGYLITSPTRDHKLEPVHVMPKAVAKDSKVSPGRSSSAGGVHRSPKRAPRPSSMIVPGSKAQVNVVLNGAASEAPPRKMEVKRPRPTSLATSAQPMARPKTAPSMRIGAKGPHVEEVIPRTHSAEPTRAAKFVGVPAGVHAPPGVKPSVPRAVPKSAVPAMVPTAVLKEPPTKSTMMVNGEDEKMDADSLDGEVGKGPHLARSESQEIEETIMMKSPPEPTRVKSPEQILVRSPEPVKWTIPLETGIKWTGTPKCEGDPIKISKEEPLSPPLVASPVEPPIPQSLDIMSLSLLENGDSSLSSEQQEDLPFDVNYSSA